MSDSNAGRDGDQESLSDWSLVDHEEAVADNEQQEEDENDEIEGDPPPKEDETENEDKRSDEEEEEDESRDISDLGQKVEEVKGGPGISGTESSDIETLDYPGPEYYGQVFRRYMQPPNANFGLRDSFADYVRVLRPLHYSGDADTESLSSEDLPEEKIRKRRSRKPEATQDEDTDLSLASSPALPDDLPAIKPDSQYVHTPHNEFNRRLNIVVALTMACVIGLGLGHFLGWSSRSLWEENVNAAQVRKLRELQDNLLSCMSSYPHDIPDDSEITTEPKCPIDYHLEQAVDEKVYESEIFLEMDLPNLLMKDTDIYGLYESSSSSGFDSLAESLEDTGIIIDNENMKNRQQMDDIIRPIGRKSEESEWIEDSAFEDDYSDDLIVGFTSQWDKIEDDEDRSVERIANVIPLPDLSHKHFDNELYLSSFDKSTQDWVEEYFGNNLEDNIPNNDLYGNKYYFGDHFIVDNADELATPGNVAVDEKFDVKKHDYDQNLVHSYAHYQDKVNGDEDNDAFVETYIRDSDKIVKNVIYDKHLFTKELNLHLDQHSYSSDDVSLKSGYLNEQSDLYPSYVELDNATELSDKYSEYSNLSGNKHSGKMTKANTNVILSVPLLNDLINTNQKENFHSNFEIEFNNLFAIRSPHGYVFNDVLPMENEVGFANENLDVLAFTKENKEQCKFPKSQEVNNLASFPSGIPSSVRNEKPSSSCVVKTASSFVAHIPLTNHHLLFDSLPTSDLKILGNLKAENEVLQSQISELQSKNLEPFKIKGKDGKEARDLREQINRLIVDNEDMRLALSRNQFSGLEDADKAEFNKVSQENYHLRTTVAQLTYLVPDVTELKGYFQSLKDEHHELLMKVGQIRSEQTLPKELTPVVKQLEEMNEMVNEEVKKHGPTTAMHNAKSYIAFMKQLLSAFTYIHDFEDKSVSEKIDIAKDAFNFMLPKGMKLPAKVQEEVIKGKSQFNGIKNSLRTKWKQLKELTRPENIVSVGQATVGKMNRVIVNVVNKMKEIGQNTIMKEKSQSKMEAAMATLTRSITKLNKQFDETWQSIEIRRKFNAKNEAPNDEQEVTNAGNKVETDNTVNNETDNNNNDIREKDTLELDLKSNENEKQENPEYDKENAQRNGYSRNRNKNYKKKAVGAKLNDNLKANDVRKPKANDNQIKSVKKIKNYKGSSSTNKISASKTSNKNNEDNQNSETGTRYFKGQYNKFDKRKTDNSDKNNNSENSNFGNNSDGGKATGLRKLWDKPQNKYSHFRESGPKKQFVKRSGKKLGLNYEHDTEGLGVDVSNNGRECGVKGKDECNDWDVKRCNKSNMSGEMNCLGNQKREKDQFKPNNESNNEECWNEGVEWRNEIGRKKWKKNRNRVVWANVYDKGWMVRKNISEIINENIKEKHWKQIIKSKKWVDNSNATCLLNNKKMKENKKWNKETGGKWEKVMNVNHQKINVEDKFAIVTMEIRKHKKQMKGNRRNKYEIVNKENTINEVKPKPKYESKNKKWELKSNDKYDKRLKHEKKMKEYKKNEIKIDRRRENLEYRNKKDQRVENVTKIEETKHHYEMKRERENEWDNDEKFKKWDSDKIKNGDKVRRWGKGEGKSWKNNFRDKRKSKWEHGRRENNWEDAPKNEKWENKRKAMKYENHPKVKSWQHQLKEVNFNAKGNTKKWNMKEVNENERNEEIKGTEKYSEHKRKESWKLKQEMKNLKYRERKEEPKDDEFEKREVKHKKYEKKLNKENFKHSHDQKEEDQYKGKNKMGEGNDREKENKVKYHKQEEAKSGIKQEQKTESVNGEKEERKYISNKRNEKNGEEDYSAINKYKNLHGDRNFENKMETEISVDKLAKKDTKEERKSGKNETKKIIKDTEEGKLEDKTVKENIVDKTLKVTTDAETKSTLERNEIGVDKNQDKESKNGNDDKNKNRFIEKHIFVVESESKIIKKLKIRKDVNSSNADSEGDEIQKIRKVLRKVIDREYKNKNTDENKVKIAINKGEEVSEKEKKWKNKEMKKTKMEIGTKKKNKR